MARNLLAGLVGVIWALWLGGLGALFLFVTVLFNHHRNLFHQSAPALFQIFERYQLLLAALALSGTMAWRLLQKRRMLALLFILFALAGAGAAVNAAVFTPRMEKLRLLGQTASPAFGASHGASMLVYLLELLLLLGAGGVFFAAMLGAGHRLPSTLGAKAGSI